MDKKQRTSKKPNWKQLMRLVVALVMGGGGLVMVLMGAGGTGSLVYALSVSEGVGRFALESQLGDWIAYDSEEVPQEEESYQEEEQQSAEESATPQQTPTPDSQPAPDHDDLTEPEIPSVDAQDIVARTLVPSASIGYDSWGDVYIYNQTDLTVDVESLLTQELDITLASGDDPQILIIHTHGTEAYTPEGDNTYIESDDYRTLDETQSIIAIGDEITRVFTEMGLKVIHDTVCYDYPDYNSSYSLSGEAVAAYLEEYPSIQIVLDVHRDALVGEDGTVYKTVTEFDSPQAAQVMLVAGSGNGNYEDWQENLALATQLQERMNSLYPTLARPITMRTSLYNQDLSIGSILVEVGSHGNTLEEAILGARYFAMSAGQLFLTLVEW